MSATNILQQVQDMLIKKYDNDIEIKSGEIDEMFGPGFVNQYPDKDNDDAYDITNSGGADVPYTTNVPTGPPSTKKAINKMKNPMSEAEGIDTEEEATGVADKALAAADAAGEEAGAEAGAEAGGEAGMDADMNMGDVGGAGGMDNLGSLGMQEEEEKTPTELGRIYELKKIYTRLTSIEAYLGNESDPQLLEVRNYVSQGIELFEVVSSNFNSYKDRLNEIIVMYYKFILEVYESVKSIYAKQARKSGDK